MTPQPQKENHIDPALFELINAKEWFEKYGSSMMPGYFDARISAYKRMEKEQIRSRPATTAPPTAPEKPIKRNYDGNSFACSECKSFYWKTADEPAPCNSCEYRIKEEQEIHDTAIRNATLDEAITQCEWDHPITQEDVWRKLESLRTPTKGEYKQ